MDVFVKEKKKFLKTFVTLKMKLNFYGQALGILSVSGMDDYLFLLKT